MNVFFLAPDRMNLLFRDVAVVILVRPDWELFQDGNVVQEGVLREGFPLLALTPFSVHRSLRRFQRPIVPKKIQ